MPDVVLIAEGHVGGAAGLQQPVEGGGGAKPVRGGWQPLNPDGVEPLPAFQDAEGAITGFVIEHQQTLRAALLVPETLQLKLEKPLAVAGGQHHLQLGGHHHCRPHLRK